MKLFFSLFFCCFCYLSLLGQLQEIQFKDLDEQGDYSQKHTIVFIHTDWCMVCKMTAQTSLKNKKLVQLINENFNYISLNAEKQEDIVFRNHVYKYDATNRMHELAYALSIQNGRIAYPTFSIINTNKEIVFQYAGYLSAKNLMKILKKLINNISP